MRKRPPSMADWLIALLLLGGVAAGTASHAGKAQPGTVVRDLYSGEALFHFYAQDDFTALTHLLAARDAGRLTHHEADAELLLGGLYLSYGQHARAQAIFERLLARSDMPAVHDRAWFYLGKLRYQRGLADEALHAFGRIGARLPEPLAAELPMLVAQCHMAQGDFAAAERVLAAWEAPGSWLGYARYNLGVALVRLGETARGARLLDAVGRMPADTAETRALRDKANLALGYAYLQANDGRAARPVLQRVRLRGPFANKALLGAGWAEALASDYRAALVPWLELTGRDLLDSAVQESFLAVPYALGRLDAHGSAVERYQRALGAFDEEIARIDGAIARARTGTLLPALLAEDDVALGRWYWRLESLPDDADSRYLYHLLAAHDFQEGLKNYRDLLALGRNLEHWRGSLDTFATMVDARRSAFAGRLPATRERLARTDIGALRARRDALRARLEQAERERDIVALATAEEQDRWHRLEAIAADPRFPAPGNDELRERHRILTGVLAWSLDRDFRARLWRQRRSLAALERALETAEEQLTGIAAVQDAEPARFDDFAARIAGLEPRIAAMQASLGAVLGRQEETLVALAVEELGAQKERLASYRVQARFALATMYDRAGGARTAAHAGDRQ